MVLTKVGQFTLRTTDGSQAITDVGFTPKAIILFSHESNSTGWTADYAVTSIGFATAANSMACVYAAAQTGVACPETTPYRYGSSSYVIVAPEDQAGAIGYSATLTSFDSGGFTLAVTNAVSYTHLRAHETR